MACITLQFCSFKCELIDLPDISLLLVNDVSTDEGVGPANGSSGPLFDLVEEVGVRGKAALGREWAGTRPPDGFYLLMPQSGLLSLPQCSHDLFEQEVAECVLDLRHETPKF